MIYLILTLLFAIIIGIFAVQNAEVVSIRFMPWGFNLSLALVILGSAGIGALAAGIASLKSTLRWRHRVRELANSVHSLEEQVRSLQARAQSAEDGAEPRPLSAQEGCDEPQ